MDDLRLSELIQRLIDEGRKNLSESASSSLKNQDEVGHLNSAQKLAWAQLLSSAASAEESEEMVIEPILQAFHFSEVMQTYLTLHAADESRHQDLLKSYIRNSFNYEKTKKTVTDKVIYDGVFKLLRPTMAKRPVMIIVATLFYEWFAEEFYADLIAAADRDQLPVLKNLFTQIEKDEKRHRAGLKAVLHLWKQSGKSVDWVDLFLTKMMLMIVRLDVNTAWWAFYNKKLKNNLKAVGLKPDVIYSRSKSYANKAYQELRIVQGAV